MTTRSTLASPPFKGLATEHTTVKWTIGNFASVHSSLASVYVEFTTNLLKVTESSLVQR